MTPNTQQQQPRTIFEQLAAAIGTTNANVVDLYALTQTVAKDVAEIKAALYATEAAQAEEGDDGPKK
jgi:hypothetical protein